MSPVSKYVLVSSQQILFKLFARPLLFCPFIASRLNPFRPWINLSITLFCLNILISSHFCCFATTEWKDASGVYQTKNKNKLWGKKQRIRSLVDFFAIVVLFGIPLDERSQRCRLRLYLLQATMNSPWCCWFDEGCVRSGSISFFHIL